MVYPLRRLIWFKGLKEIRLSSPGLQFFSTRPDVDVVCDCPTWTAMPPPQTKKQKTSNYSAAKAVDETKLVQRRDDDFLSVIEQKRLTTAPSVVSFNFQMKRVRVLSSCEEFPNEHSGVLYWMSRDQRVQDNWALLFAQKLALKMATPLHVCFCLVPKFLEATIRHYGFMLKGLQEVQQECEKLDIGFHLLMGYAQDVLPQFIMDHGIGGVVTDFCPLRLPTQWVSDMRDQLPEDVPFFQVDAHNVVPCWEASSKLEYGARTIRKKLMDQLSTYLTEFPPVIQHPHPSKTKPQPVDWQSVHASLEVDRSVGEVDWVTPGTTGGLRNLESFIKSRLKSFSTSRNDPNKSALSNMSPWYHFGQVSVQRAMLKVKELRAKYSDSVAAYIEEGIVRRELADNFCYFNDNYDNVGGAWEWARKTLDEHRKDQREYVYTRDQLEEARTHDHLWNAAQIQMVREGKMHGFLRMYWAKKILEWTESPEQALEFAIYLNDRYQLDGRDPNGYVGCMWSICGIHDQGWAERAIFGKIRYMNYNGCKRKFDVQAFVQKYEVTPALNTTAKK